MSARYDPRIAVRGDGEPVVLVPGMDGTGGLFYRQVEFLERSFRVATYALRDSTRDMTTLVDDLAEVVAHVAPRTKRAIVIGESFGGALSLSFALAHPEQVRALVVVNSFPFFAPQFRLHLALAALEIVPWGAMGVVRRLTAFRLHSPRTHRKEIRRFLELTKAATERGYRNRLHVLTRYDVREQLKDVCCPTLFLASDRDNLVPALEQARLMSARVPRAVMRVLEGHGHICLIAPGIELDAILREWDPSLATEEPQGPRRRSPAGDDV